MKIENPYQNVLGAVGVAPAVERAKHHAWEEGYDYAVFTEGRTITQDDYDAAYEEGYHSRDEVVDGLLEALDDALVAIDPYQWAFTRERVKQAIAKAKP